ncbi:MAG: molybdate ABC transporter substrate-binding protein [Pseudomonadota bacterium]
MNPISRLFLSICAVLAALWAAPVQAQVTVFSAASLRGALEEVAAASGIEITVSYGGSGLMARQIAQGAPADIVLLANAAWMTWLEGQGALKPGTQKVFLSNDLVLVGPKGADPIATADADTILMRLNGGRLALGQTQAVPAGIYAREWMEATGLWPALRPYLAETENVRAALALVARGEVPLGIVYTSDAMAETGVDIVHHIDQNQHAPITYPAAIVAGRDRPEVQAFHDFLTTETAQDIFAAYGFVRAEDLK